jgi:hypothetical protein
VAIAREVMEDITQPSKRGIFSTEENNNIK